ncbi:MAG: hypothetical protein LBT01_06205 [Spirochaetaceae bacterium]|nr:hypothetical protein [Spirochaetaceae bacterium]
MPFEEGKIIFLCASAALIGIVISTPFLFSRIKIFAGKKPCKPIVLFSVLFYSISSALIDILFYLDVLPMLIPVIILHAVLLSVFALNMYLATR